ncbi:MAG: type IV pilin-like G/H family protein [Cyanobacteria bacterium J06632_22]
MSARKFLWFGVLGLLGATSAGLIVKSSFLAQPACACANPGKGYVGAFARAQQAHFLEQDEFATAIRDLGLNIGDNAAESDKTTTTATHDIQIAVTETAAFTYVYSANPTNPESFVSGVFLVPDAAPGVFNTKAIVCEAPTAERLQAPIDAQTCAPGNTPVP